MKHRLMVHKWSTNAILALLISLATMNSWASFGYDRAKVSFELMHADHEIERLGTIFTSEICKGYLDISGQEVLEAFKIVTREGSKDEALSHIDNSYKELEKLDNDWWSCMKLAKQTGMAKKYLTNAKNHLNN